MRTRKTVDCWRIYLNYGQGWELECVEFTRATMRENARAYRANCNYPLRVQSGRERIPDGEDGRQLLAEIAALKAAEALKRLAKLSKLDIAPA